MTATIAVTWIATSAVLGLALGWFGGYGHGYRAHDTAPFRLVDRAPVDEHDRAYVSRLWAEDWLALAQQPRQIASHACPGIAATSLEYRARHLARQWAPRALEMAT